jgi:hypothetical protein
MSSYERIEYLTQREKSRNFPKSQFLKEIFQAFGNSPEEGEVGRERRPKISSVSSVRDSGFLLPSERVPREGRSGVASPQNYSKSTLIFFHTSFIFLSYLFHFLSYSFILLFSNILSSLFHILSLFFLLSLSLPLTTFINHIPLYSLEREKTFHLV